MDLSKSFEEAKQEPAIRQEFLDAIDLEWAKPFIEKVVYEKKVGDYHMATKPDPASLLHLRGAPSILFVRPHAFESSHIQTFADMQSVLIDHEGRHAEQFFNHPEIFCGLLIENMRAMLWTLLHKPHRTREDSYRSARVGHIAEWDAYRFQLRQIEQGKRKVSGQFQHRVQARMYESRNAVRYLEKSDFLPQITDEERDNLLFLRAFQAEMRKGLLNLFREQNRKGFHWRPSPSLQ